MTTTTIEEVLQEALAQASEDGGNTVNGLITIRQEAIATIEQLVFAQVIGEDERIDIQSEFDKLDVPHLETDKYPGLDGVRQASRNLLRGRQRQALSQLLRGKET